MNNVVDITNYILFTYGEPLHAFDLDKIASQSHRAGVRQFDIRVRRAGRGEKIITIDGQEKILESDILVIADAEKPVAVAGIMGGRDTEVTGSTKNILLEAAVFNPVLIRRGRQKLGLQSESSYRFERGIDIGIVEAASVQAAALIQELAGGSCILSSRAGVLKAKEKTVVLDAERARGFLGVNIASGQIKKILSNLGFYIRAKTKNSFYVTAPSYRPDINTEIDLVEEVARIYGYDAVPKSLPAVKPRVWTDKKRDLRIAIKNILTALGLSEVITYSLTDKDKLQDFTVLMDSPAIEILNPLSKEQGVLRPTLLPGLLSCVAVNLNQKQDYIYIFEIASEFRRQAGQVKEELVLGIAACGDMSLLLRQGLVREEIGVLHLKGVLETLFARLGIKDYQLQHAASADTIEIFVGQEKLGFIRVFPGALLDKFEIKNRRVCGLEIFLDKLFPYINCEKKFVPLPIYPAITRDFSIILQDDAGVEGILRTIKGKGTDLLQGVQVVDYYKGKQIPSGCKGLTISCLYRSAERTLTEEEVDVIQAAVRDALIKERGVRMRI